MGIQAFGFAHGGYGGGTNSCETRDPSTGSWTTKTSATDSRDETGILSRDSDKNWAVATGAGTSVEEFSYTGNSWTGKTAITQSGRVPAVDISGTGVTTGCRSGTTTAVYHANYSGNSWSTHTSIGTGGGMTVSFLYDSNPDYAVCAFGYTGSSQSKCERYSLSGDAWTVRTSTPGTNSEIAGFSPGNMGFCYYFGLSQWRAFYFAGDTWTTIAAAHGANGPGGSVSGSNVCASFGYEGSITNVQTFLPQTNTWTAATSAGVGGAGRCCNHSPYGSVGGGGGGSVTIISAGQIDYYDLDGDAKPGVVKIVYDLA